MFIVAILFCFLISAYGAGAQELPDETGWQPLAELSSRSEIKSRTVYVVWDRVDDGTVRGYRVHLGFDSGRYFIRSNVGNVTSFAMNLPTRFTWYLSLTAYNNAGESPYSEELVIILP